LEARRGFVLRHAQFRMRRGAAIALAVAVLLVVVAYVDAKLHGYRRKHKRSDSYDHRSGGNEEDQNRHGNEEDEQDSRSSSGGMPMYSPNCLRPSSGGKFPKCDPRGRGRPCCIGLTCEANPNDPSEYRCGNSMENDVGSGNTKEKGGGYDYQHLWGPHMRFMVMPNDVNEGDSSPSRVILPDRGGVFAQALHSFIYSSVLLIAGGTVIAVVRHRWSLGFFY